MVREQEGQCVLRFCGYMAMVVWGDRGIWACDRGTQLRGCGGYSIGVQGLKSGEYGTQ